MEMLFDNFIVYLPYISLQFYNDCKELVAQKH